MRVFHCHRIFPGMAGFALIEMSIASMMLLLMVFACLEAGIMIYDQGVVSAASREAARAGVVMRNPRLSDAQIMQVATGYSSGLIGFSGSAVTTTVSHPGSDAIGARLGVTVTYQYRGLILHVLVNRFRSNSMGASLNIVGSTTMYME